MGNIVVFQSRKNFSGFPPSEASPEFAALGLSGLRTGQTNEACGGFPNWPTQLKSVLSTPCPFLKEKQSDSWYELGVNATRNLEAGPIQKRFLIFDRSGDRTKLFVMPLCPNVQHPTIAATVPIHDCALHDEIRVANIERRSPIMPIPEEISADKNNVHEASEIHEDTEEINALLYSDDDDGDGDDDDEVTSTDRSPLVIKGSYEKLELDKEIKEEVASSDGPTKRQRLSDGGYKKSSSIDIVKSVKLVLTHENDKESSCVKGRTREENMGSISRNNCPRKDKIRKTLEILQSIVPGVESKDPLLVIDEAINYLKVLKLKAKALGVGDS